LELGKPRPPGGVRVNGLCLDDFRKFYVIRHTVEVVTLVSVFVKRFSAKKPATDKGQAKRAAKPNSENRLTPMG